MNILLTVPRGVIRDLYFPESVMKKLRALGNLICNEMEKPYIEEELAERIRDIDICVTHWFSPFFTKKIVDNANRLRLIAHAAGSVAVLVDQNVYDKGIKVVSANGIMAQYVAESTLARILSSLGKVNDYDRRVRDGGWKIGIEEYGVTQSLFYKKVGFIGFGAVGNHMLKLMHPFQVAARIYDPYIKDEALKRFPRTKRCNSVEEVLGWADIITIHASQTPETHHLINAEGLKRIRDNALFVNTARGSLVNETALLAELLNGRFYAALDVFDPEPPEPDAPIRKLDNVLLSPHIAGTAGREELTLGIIGDIERFIKNKHLKYEISGEKYRLMTR